MSFSIKIGLAATLFLIAIALFGVFVIYVAFLQNDFLIFIAGYVLILAAIISFFGLGVADVMVKRKKYFDMNRLKGEIAEAKMDIEKGSKGVVYAEGEEWTAFALEDIKQGDELIIEDVEKGILYVKKRK
ncbi:MAG TPA: NfeD family protein [Geobacterales bacterium]|nr:NfeD family protein [Geobacterales bacterium]